MSRIYPIHFARGPRGPRHRRIGPKTSMSATRFSPENLLAARILAAGGGLFAPRRGTLRAMLRPEACCRAAHVAPPPQLSTPPRHDAALVVASHRCGASLRLLPYIRRCALPSAPTHQSRYGLRIHTKLSVARNVHRSANILPERPTAVCGVGGSDGLRRRPPSAAGGPSSSRAPLTSSSR